MFRRGHRSLRVRFVRQLAIVLAVVVPSLSLPIGPAIAAHTQLPSPLIPIPTLPPVNPAVVLASVPQPVPDWQRVPVPAPREGLNIPQAAPELPSASTPTELIAGLIERRAQDSAEASVYKFGGGTHLLDVTSVPQNYQTPDGVWHDIDPTLVAEGAGYRNVAGPAGAFFPSTLTPEHPVTLAIGSGSLSLAPVGADPAATAQVDGIRVTYPDALPGTDLRYTSLPDGYAEEAVLKVAQQADRLSWDVTVSGLTLRTEATGEISVLDGETVVAVLTRPSAHDSNIDPATGEGARSDAFVYTLEDLGGGSYRLDVVFDAEWLADPARVYPVTIDPSPQVRDLRPSTDTYVYSCGSANYSGDPEIRVGYPNTCGYRGLLNFDVSPYVKADRVVYNAQLGLYKTFDSGTDPVIANRVTSSWSASTVTWPGPSIGTSDISTPPGPDPWHYWELGPFYQQILDGTTTDNGIRLGASEYHRFASNNTTISGAQGHLTLVFNDLPDATTLADPGNGSTIETESPTLAVTAMPTDYNSDDTWVKFEVANTADFGDSIVVSSPWVDSKSWGVDAGYLKDGQTYYWRAVSGDVCQTSDGDDVLCSATDADNVTHSRARSTTTRSFSVSLPHYGSDERWAMWSQGLGNGMNLQVNKANGNLFLDYPLDAISTPIGPLSLSLTYNSQLPDNVGIGGGWNIGAGPFADGLKIPIRLDKLSQAYGDTVRIKFRDGDRAYFPHAGGETYRSMGAGSGLVTHAVETSGVEETWTYTTPEGSRYVFDADGKLTRAKPTTEDYGEAGFRYLFSNDAGRLQLTWIKDPLGRRMDFTWSGAAGARQLTAITAAWDTSRTWGLGYWGATGPLAAVADPSGDVVLFGYDPTSGLLANVSDGEATSTSPLGPPTAITYTAGPPARATSIKAPGATNPTQFAYGAVLNGSIVEIATATDPRGPNTPADAWDDLVATQFNTAGLPILDWGPYVMEGTAVVWPFTRSLWDTNQNLLCSRSPLAEAVIDGCVPGTETGALDTDYRYDTRSPYSLLEVTGPAPNADGSGTPAHTTYAYDEGFGGLDYQRFDTKEPAGVPVSEAISDTLEYSWGAGHPAGISVTDRWSIRLAGEITAPNTREWSFRLTSEDGARLVIGKKTLVDCWATGDNPVQTNCGQGRVTKYLEAGKRSKMIVEYRHITGSNAQLKVEWQQQDGSWIVVPLSRLNPDLNLVTTAADALGTTTTAYANDNLKLRGLASSRTRSGPATPARTTSLAYDASGRMTTEANAAGTVTSTYTDTTTTSCLTRRVDRAGAITDYECNTAGDVTKTIAHVPAVTGTDQSTAQDREVVTTYDLLGRVLTVSVPHPAGVTATPACTSPVLCTKNMFDHAGRLLTVTDPMGLKGTYQYDTQGRLRFETKPDPDLDPATSTNGPLLSPVIEHRYDDAGNETSTIDARGKTWGKAFDGQNRVVAATDPTGATTTSAYSLAARTTRVTDAAGVYTTATADILGRKVSEALGALPATTYDYDAAGNVTKVTYPSPTPKVYVENVYNAFGQVTKETRPTGTGGAAASVDYIFDDAGRESQRKDQRNNITSYTYDGEGRLTSVVLPSSLGIPNFTYDAAGERVKAMSGGGRVRFWSYDVRGRLAAFRDTAGTTSNTYDEDGRLVRSDDPRPLSERFAYDALGRRIRRYGVTVPGGATVGSETYAYDEAGNLKTAQNATYTATVNYDNAGRLKDVLESGLDTHYTYVNGQLTARSDPSGTLAFSYRSGDGLVASFTDSLSAGPTTFGYDTWGRQVTRTETGNLITTRGYDAAGRVTAQDVRKGTGGAIDSFSLGYDSASNVVSKTQSVWGYTTADQGTWTYVYDSINRMTQSHPPSGNYTAYGYDSEGNRTDVWVGTSHVTTTYDTANRPTSSSDGTTYTVDAVGQLTAITGSSRSFTYTYDTWGRRTSATSAGGKPSVQFAHDALDRTVDRTEYTTTGSVHDSYGYVGLSEDLASVIGGHPTQIAQGPGGPISEKTGLLTSSVVTDLHGDVVGSIDRTTGLPTGAKAYGPYGEPHGVATFNTPLGFQSDLTDSITGFVDMGTRDYDPLIGRFTSRDVLFGEPTRPVSLNQFVYGGDNPVTMSDPNGMRYDYEGGGGPDCRCGYPEFYDPPPSGPGRDSPGERRADRAESLTIPQRRWIVRTFFSLYPGSTAYGQFGFGQALNDFMEYEVQAGLIGRRPGQSAWFARVNGLMVLDMLDAMRVLRRGGSFSHNRGVQSWINYGIDTSPGGRLTSRAGQQSAFWTAHQISLHRGIRASGAQLGRAAYIDRFDAQVMSSITQLVDDGALENLQTDSALIGNFVTLVYPISRPVDAFTAFAFGAGATYSAQNENVGLESTRW